MKTKRITMLIEILVFTSGIVLACYFTFLSNLSVQSSNLLCNLCIGLSTGGLVAFLIEIPNYLAVRKQTETVLHINSQYIYMYLAQLQDAIIKMQLNPSNNYVPKFAEWYFNRILPLVFPILSADNEICLCKCKNIEITRLQKELNELATNMDVMLAPFTIKYNAIQISAMENGNITQIINGFLEPELTAFLGATGIYMKTIDDVMQIVCSKKQVVNWNLKISSIKNALYKSNVDLQKNKKEA